ncbi:MAG: NAD-dependent epimerase/dehydratase family protein [Chitinophagales bacterium]|nr:NAD-dependent epimerase/dehydratase family protein [Chitinophagales bacterium]MDW8419605.1 NAD-dependent epimerase/dehydratase family protein [Chitinophagales bacterium]
MSETILVTGACGQIGSELVPALRKVYNRVIASDLKEPPESLNDASDFIRLDVLYKNGLLDCIRRFKVTQVYHLAAVLSATGERNPEMAWRINMKGLRNVLDVCAANNVRKLFFPSTIAVFGPTTPKNGTPQFTVMEPNTIYGISKLAGERWCHWYHLKTGLDVRGLRYPGLISYKTKAGGGTTDYAVEIFFEAVQHKKYVCYLSENTVLPMMYMPDAIRGTIELMEAPAERISTRSSYNFSGISFSPAELAAEIKKHIPEFTIQYQPDFRQQIADGWPQSIDDSVAQRDWGWQPAYSLQAIVVDMLQNIRRLKSSSA